MKIPISKTYFDAADEEAILAPLRNGWVVQGPQVAEFEQAFADFCGAKFAVATTSCTTALHIAAIAAGIQPGDEVLVPAFTWVATANAIEYIGAKPVFCDISLDTFNLDVSRLEGLINEKTKAVLPVHLFGWPAEMNAILDLAQKHSLQVIEDAACGFGTYYHGKHVGAFGHSGCFSFHPRKAFSTGEGGMITTNDEKTADLLRTLRDHGGSRSDFQRQQHQLSFLLSEYNVLGYNYRMTDLQGALGVSQMKKADWMLSRRREIAQRYNEGLSHIDWLRLPQPPSEAVHAYQAYVCLFQPEKPGLSRIENLFGARNRLMAFLEERGVSTRQGTHAPAHLGFYVEKYGIRPEDCPNAYMAERLSLALPLYPQLTEEEQQYVIGLIQEYNPKQ
ncbi:MAG: DegT/DnrJ/EryC1/StrS family aminotransferase [Lewinellaceae bacterium]|nr:DegT/DnrJ/EryC1/StrS family aminotransferase [Lewinellaceae bacterium]